MSELDAEDLAHRLTDRAPAGIAAQIGQLIEAKVLPVDSRLPTVRDLAQELGVSVGTIAQAWSHLREQGLVETRRRGGTRVLARARRRAEDFAGPGSPLKHLAFVISGVSAPDPGSALEATLRVITHAEVLGFDAVWLSSSGEAPGLPGVVPALAATTQRTSRIGLGLISDGDALRNDPDLTAVDLLSKGRLNLGSDAPLTRTVIPTDTARREQEARYREITSRSAEHTLIGTSDEIADALLADSEYLGADVVAFTLPAALDEADCNHLLAEVATRVGPALGWKPSPR